MFFQNISDQLDSLNVCIQNWEQQEYLQKSIQEINSFFRQIQNPNEIRCAVLGQKAVDRQAGLGEGERARLAEAAAGAEDHGETIEIGLDAVPGVGAHAAHG